MSNTGASLDATELFDADLFRAGVWGEDALLSVAT